MLGSELKVLSYRIRTVKKTLGKCRIHDGDFTVEVVIVKRTPGKQTDAQRLEEPGTHGISQNLSFFDST